MKDWILLKDEKPTVEKHGEKVLKCSNVNSSQAYMAITIHNTVMIKHCDENETWWMPLPELPKNHKIY